MKTDSLLNSDNVFIDVDEIINKYNNGNDTKTLVGEEIWSEPIDVFSSNKHQDKPEKDFINILEKQKNNFINTDNTKVLAPRTSNTRALSLDDIQMTSKLNIDPHSPKTTAINNTSRLDMKVLSELSLNNTKLMTTNDPLTIDNIDNTSTDYFLDKEMDSRLNQIENKLNKTDKLDEFIKPQSSDSRLNQTENKLNKTDKLDEFIKPQSSKSIIVEQIELDFLNKETTPLKKLDTKILTKTKPIDLEQSQLDKMYTNFETSELDNSVVFSSKDLTSNNLKDEIAIVNNVSKILFNDTNVINNDLTKQINDADNISFNQKVLEKKISFWNSRSISKENKQKNKLQTKNLIKTLPRFYRFEYMYIKLILILFVILSTISIATLTYVLVQIFALNQSSWLLLPQGFFNLFSFTLLIFAINRLFYVRKEIKINNYTIGTEKSTPYIKKIYRSLSTSCILLNWLAASIYIVVIAGIILTFVVSYFYNLINDQINQFGLLSLDHGNNIVPLICVWTFAGAGIFFIIWQIVANVLNKKRKNEIELFYQQELISEELVQKYRKAATVKGMVIFFSITIVITVVGLLVWLVLKRKALKK